MTEAEWLTATDPMPMFRCLWKKSTDRKFRLFGAACIRFIWSLGCEEPPSAVGTVEEFADATATKAALRKARVAMRQERYCLNEVTEGMRQRWLGYWLTEVAASEKGQGMVLSELMRLSAEVADVRIPEPPALCNLFRDIFGNPFRPVAFDPRWRTADAVALARGIYDERAFDRLPLLADALMDAGCADEAVLAHCRGDGPHVRGCWVVDLVLGKEGAKFTGEPLAVRRRVLTRALGERHGHFNVLTRRLTPGGSPLRASLAPVCTTPP